MSPPTVSVLMPVRDAAATLGATLDSLRRQRRVDWECVAVDDGSTDESRALLGRAATRDPRIRVVEQPARGIVESLQRGLRDCRAPVVARMDADDLMHRDRLRLQVEHLQRHPELSATGCHVRLFPRRHLQEGRRAYERWLNSLACAADVRRDAFVECPIAHPTLAIRRPVLERHGYRDRGWPEDYDLILRLLGAGESVGVLPRRLLHWRDHPQRLSRTSPTYGIDRFTACKAHHLAAGLLAEHDRYLLWGYGKTGRALANALRPLGKRPSVIVELHPGRLGQRIAGAPVIHPRLLRDAREERPGQPLLASVARAEPRAEVRAALARLGLVEGTDYVCAA